MLLVWTELGAKFALSPFRPASESQRGFLGVKAETGHNIRPVKA